MFTTKLLMLKSNTWICLFHTMNRFKSDNITVCAGRKSHDTPMTVIILKYVRQPHFNVTRVQSVKHHSQICIQDEGFRCILGEVGAIRIANM